MCYKREEMKEKESVCVRKREREMLSAFLMESSCFGDPFAKETASIFQTQEDRRCIKTHFFFYCQKFPAVILAKL